MLLVDLKQDSPEWHDFRRSHLGASDIAVLMTGSPQEVHELYLEKTTGKTRFVTDAMRRGKEMEAIARTWYNLEFEENFAPAVGVHEAYPWLMASFDGYEPDKKRILEIKCPNVICDVIYEQPNFDRWAWQMQAQFAVSGFEEGVLLAYKPEEQRWASAYRVQSLITEIIEAGEEFMRCVVNYDPPKWRKP